MAEKFTPQQQDQVTNDTRDPKQMNPLMGVYGNVPGQDPSFLTTQQLAVAIVGLRELLEARMNAMDKAVVILQGVVNRSPTVGEVVAKEEERFRAIETHVERAIAQARELQASGYDAVDAKLNGLDLVTKEKFASVEARTEVLFTGIDKQFIERDKRTEQLSTADKTAVAAALQAQKESAASTDESNRIANTKMETNFTKLIEQTQLAIQQNTKNTDDKINDIKSRLDKGEGRSTLADPAMANGLMDIKALLTSRDLLAGHAQGQKDYTALIIAVGGFAAVAVPAILLLLKTVMGH